jgi:hypothetical protein
MTRSGWRNRVVGSREEDPTQLLANPANWRLHPKEQQEALAGALSEVGLGGTGAGQADDWPRRRWPPQGRAGLQPRRADRTCRLRRAIRGGRAAGRGQPGSAARMLAELADQHGIRRSVLGDPDIVPPVPDEKDVYSSRVTSEGFSEASVQARARELADDARITAFELPGGRERAVEIMERRLRPVSTVAS